MSSSCSPESRDPNALMTKLQSRLDQEVEAILRESAELDRRGQLDAAAKKRIEARLEELITRFKQEMTARLAEIHATSRHEFQQRIVLPRRLRLPGLLLALLIAVGALLEATMGDAFIFAAAPQYRSAMPVMFFALLIPVAVGWLALERNSPDMAARYPTWWVRWFVMFPLVVALTSGLIIVSPLGWAALSGLVTGVPTEGAEAIVASIDSTDSISRRCGQLTRLDFRGATATVCLGGRYSGRPLKDGDKLVLAGRLSRFGFFIEAASVR